MYVKKIVTDKKKTYYIKNSDDNFHCKDGMIKQEDFSKNKIVTNTGKELFVSDASMVDQFNNFKRSAQIMDPKDLGFILGNTLVGKNSIVYDCGSGTGASACFFALYVKKVYSFDVRQDHIDTLKENVKRLELKNIKTKLANIYFDDLEVKEKCDLFVLDVPEPEKAVGNIDKNLKIGGFLASYSPCITQSSKLIDNLPENFTHIKTVEVIERHWHVGGQRIRPKTKEFSHSGFISIMRKFSEN